MSYTSTFGTEFAKSPGYKIIIEGFENLPAPMNNPFELGLRSNISSLRKEIRNFQGNIGFGRLNINIIDYNDLIATYLGDTPLLGKAVTVMSVDRDDPNTIYGTIFDGFAIESSYDYEANELNLTLADKFYALKNAYFLFDYKNVNIKIGNKVFGTVKAVSGTNVYFQMQSDLKLFDPYFGHVERIYYLDSYTVLGDANHSDVVKLSPSIYDRGWLRIDNPNEKYKNYFTEGQFVKFSPDGDYNGMPGNFEFDNLPSFRISTGTLILTEDPDLGQIYEGTIEFQDANGLNAKPGYYIYFRKPIILGGNPAEIIKDILTSGNTTLPDTVGTFGYDAAAFATLSGYYAQFSAFKVINESRPGDVPRIINNIANTFLFDVYLLNSGTVTVTPIKPFGFNLVTSGSFYNDQNSFGFKQSDDLSQVAYEIKAKFNVKEYRGATAADEVRITNPNSALRYNGRSSVIEKDYGLVNSYEVAIVNASRELFWRRRGVVKYELSAMPFALDIELGTFIDFRHQGFSGGSHALYIDTINFDPQSNVVSLGGWDYTNAFTGFLIGIWDNYTTLVESVSGTSPSGWAMIDYNRIGTLDPNGAAGITHEITGLSAGSLATVVVRNTFDNVFGVEAIKSKYTDYFLGTNLYLFKKIRVINEYTGSTRFFGTYLYRYDRIYGNNTINTGVINITGTTIDAAMRASWPVPGLRNEYGELVGGTVFNLNPDYGSTNIFW